MLTEDIAKTIRALYAEWKPFTKPSDKLCDEVRRIFNLPDSEPVDRWLRIADARAQGFLEGLVAKESYERSTART